jgi:lipopolysaccharide export system permease protein
MMKKIDKLVIRSFFGPFVLTLCVVVFIFLMQLLTQYMNELVGKDIDAIDYAKIFFYFSLISVPRALPLAVLLASLLTFGNLGEYFELTAIKSAGISVWRAMRTLFVSAIGITVFAFWYNNEVLPWANLKGYSLLYDVKTAKATLNIKEGIFYSDLPGYNIKVDKKYPDGRSLKKLVIYRHPTSDYNGGNKEIILADSGQMYTINNKSYLVFELYNGNQYSESSPMASTSNTNNVNKQFVRNRFDHYKMVVSLESFGMKRTSEDQFQYHEYMKDVRELTTISDSLQREYGKTREGFYTTSKQYFSYAFRKENFATNAPKEGKWIDSLLKKKPLAKADKKQLLANALSQSQNMLSFAKSNKTLLNDRQKSWYRYDLEMHHKYTDALSCLVMFLIGAPLGAIIKKGGFGVPVLVSVLFFIISYVIKIQGDKWAKDGIMWVWAGAWLSNITLTLVGLYFTDRALKDSRIFDKDIYFIFIERLKKRFGQSSFWQRFNWRRTAVS